MRFPLIQLLLLFPLSGIYGQDSLDVVMSGHLQEVQITEYVSALNEAPKSVAGILLTGKQVSLLDVSQLDANLAQNVSRQLFSRIPGVTIWESDGSGAQTGVAVRGLSPNRSWEFNVRQNGYDIAADPFGYPEAYYTPPMEAVSGIMMIRGSAGLQFGPQFGGLLDYVMKSGDTGRALAIESFQSVGSFGLFNSFNALGGQSGKFNYRFSICHRSADGWRENSDYEMNHLYGRLAYQPFSRLEVSAEFTALRNKLHQPGGIVDSLLTTSSATSYRARNWLATPWNIGAFDVKWQLSEKVSVRWKSAVNSSSRNSIGFTQAINVADTIDPQTGEYASRQLDKDAYRTFQSELRTQITYDLAGSEHILVGGLRYSKGNTVRLQKGVGSNGTGADFLLVDEESGFANDLDYSTINQAVFFENAFQIGKNMKLIPGMRLESIINSSRGRIGYEKSAAHFNVWQESDRLFLLYGIGWDYRTRHGVNWKANFSTSYRPVTYSQLTPSASADIIDSGLEDAFGNTYELSANVRRWEWMRLDATIYLMTYENRIGTLALQDVDGAFFKYTTNLGNSIHRGVELYCEIRPFLGSQGIPKGISGFVSAAFAKATYSDYEFSKEVNGALQQVQLSGNKVEYAPGLILHAGTSCETEELMFSLQCSHNGAVFTDANNTLAANATAEVGQLNAYTVFDFSGSWDISSRYRLKLSVNNIFDTRYATRRASGYPGRGLMPNEARSFLLTFGILL